MTVARIESLFASIYQGDPQAVLACLHDQVVVREAESLPYGGIFVGHDGFMKLQEIMLGLLRLEIKSHRLFEGTESAVAEVLVGFTGTATNETMEMPVVEVYEFKDTLISSIDVFYKDVAAMNEFLARQIPRS